MNNEPFQVEFIEDLDTRTSECRHLVDSYILHADHVDQIRVSLAQTVREMCGYLKDKSTSIGYWITELWMIERTARALGIETDS